MSHPRTARASHHPATATLRTSISIPHALHQDAQQIMHDDRCSSFSELVAFLIRLRKIERERLPPHAA